MLAAVLAVLLVAPSADPVHGQGATGVDWNKQVWLNGQPVPLDSITVEAGDVVEIEDRVWISNTNNLSFTLGAAWTDSLSLLRSQWSSGEVVTTTGGVAWEVEEAEPDTWHVFTRTYEVLPGVWLTDLITDTLEVEFFGEEQRVLRLDYWAPELFITKAVDPANQVPSELVTYTLVWGNDGGFAPGVVISDALPAEVVFVSADPPATYDPLTHDVTWGPFDLDTGDRMQATVWVTIRADVLPNTLITNVVYLLYADAPPVVAQVSHRSMAPCVKVEDVVMTLLSLPPHHTNELLQIEANLLPADAAPPFRYQFVVDGIERPTGGSTANPLSLTLAIDSAGQHTVVLKVWNCNLSIGQYVSDSFDIEIRSYKLFVPLIVRNG
jgi:uncharacterized repeat protein (TIGR01451 family)